MRPTGVTRAKNEDRRNTSNQIRTSRHRKKSKDCNFRLLSFGDVTAAKDLYTNNHHTDPDQATLNRLTGFFKVRYRTAEETEIQLKDILPGALLADSLLKELEKSRYSGVIDSIKARFGW